MIIFGSNAEEKTTLLVSFKRRPLPLEGPFDAPKDEVEASLRLVDGKTGTTYSMSESSVVDFSPTEYRASGFAFESLQGNKTGRIKFRGYLKRNTDERLVYVQVRFLTLFFMKTFDHQRNLNSCLLAKELLDVGVDSQIEHLTEDRIEQNCQIKGTFKVEGEEERTLFYLGSVGRRFPETPIQGGERKVVTINGFTGKKGYGFQFGVIANGSGYGSRRYRYGYMSKHFDTWKLMREISLSKDELEGLVGSTSLPKSKLSFEVKLEGEEDPETTFRFEVSNGRHGQKLVKINGEEEGVCFVTERRFTSVQPLGKSRATPASVQKELDSALVVSLEEPAARVTELTGGKGASLAQLKVLSTKNQQQTSEWDVPNAVVVTSSAYRLQTRSLPDFDEKLEQLERKVIGREAVEANCTAFSQWFGSKDLTEAVKEALRAKMVSEFGAEWEGSLYAVRSSAANEDSSEMSAAGQMTTYLGLSGLEKVAKAVVKCW